MFDKFTNVFVFFSCFLGTLWADDFTSKILNQKNLWSLPIGTTVDSDAIKKSFVLENGAPLEPMVKLDGQGTMVELDVNNDGNPDLILDDVPASGANGWNASNFVFLSNMTTKKLTYVGMVGTIQRIYKYPNGHCYVIESWHPGGGITPINLIRIGADSLQRSGGLEVSNEDDNDMLGKALNGALDEKALHLTFQAKE